MTRRASGRIALITTVAIAAAVVLVLLYPRGAASAGSREIGVSLGASASTCMPCHPSTGSTDRDDLVFDHASHIMVGCSACHWGAAHADGRSATPVMDSCFACHGLSHGPTGMMASGECRVCHPEPTPLRPVSHVANWAEKPHAETAAADGVNRCMMCHDADIDCDACHREQNVDLDPMPSLYISTLPIVSAEPTITVDPDAPVTIAQCAYCHPDIDDFAVEGLIFKHATHLERAYRCEACHTSFPHNEDGTALLEMRSCYRCHGLDHDGQGVVAEGACEKCHTQDFELTPTNHTVAFLSGEHKDLAREDPAYCSQCHGADDCVECHNGGVELANGQTGEKVVPADHLKPEWSQQHGGLYLAQEGLCAVCHDPVSCQQCHITTMPHPATWLSDHANMNGSLTKDCNVCHADRQTCQECHHQSVGTVALVAENCVDCHEEMKTDPPTDIKVPGLAEHAVHFAVAEPDKRGEPYYCDDCHIGFGYGGVHVVNPATGPHDMRICYECHGALDYQNKLIAPYRGAELCLRCHADLNI